MSNQGSFTDKNGHLRRDSYGMILAVRRATVLIVAGWFFIAANSTAAQPATEPAEQPRLGTYHAVFTDQDPRSDIGAQSRRHHIQIGDMQRYILSDESFEIVVPNDYDAQKPVGILVWVNAGDRGSMPRGWEEILRKNHLIFIGANNSGNDRGVAVRFGLAMDGVFNLKKSYNIDESRIYVGGTSGGGKVASMLGVIYPEIFTGSIPVVGVAYFKHIPVGDDPNKVWAASFSPPPGATLDRARQFGRFVLITGTKDMNRDSIKGTYDRGYVPDGFASVEYVEVPEMGHTLPPAEYIERAIESLDRPLESLAKSMLDLGEQLEKRRQFAEAHDLYRAVALHGEPQLASRATEHLTKLAINYKPAATQSKTPDRASAVAATRPTISREAEAQNLLSLAENYERNGLIPQAKERATRIVHDYADTKSAAAARQMLQRLDSIRP